MLRKIQTTNDTLVAVEAIGIVTAEDYEFVLIPAIERAREFHQKLRLLYLLGPEDVTAKLTNVLTAADELEHARSWLHADQPTRG